MILFVLFGQRREAYKGQYGVEALCCADEYDMHNNSDYMPERKDMYDSTGEFERTEVIKINVDEKAIMGILRPSEDAISGVISLEEY